MNRAFVTLYVLIVVSVVFVGWGINKLWDNYNYNYNPTPQVTAYERNFVLMLEAHLSNLPPEKFQTELERLGEQLSVDLSFYFLDELASSSFGEKILEGELLVLFDEGGERLIYKRIGESNNVIKIKESAVESRGDITYGIFTTIFYLSIAVVVYFWVWPLSRDVHVLEKQTRNVGRDGVSDTVSLPVGSNVQNLATAFNHMANRIRELLASRKEMTYAVSHELRTPLARMKFALEMANDSKEQEKIRKQLASIKEDVTEMDGLVNQLLAYASFEQNDESLELKAGDLSALCSFIVNTTQVEEQGLEINIDSSVKDDEVMCDWYLMERVVANLLQNAQRYAKNKINITISANDDADEKNYTLLVEDDGPGVPEEDRERLFNSFVRLRNETNSEKGGFGLGLAIVKRIIQWHKGTIKVEQSVLGGAAFIVRWPVPVK